jgi:hypothetical protein
VVITAYPVPSSDWRSIGADALYLKGANTMALPEQLKELLQRKLRNSRTYNVRSIRRARFS